MDLEIRKAGKSLEQRLGARAKNGRRVGVLSKHPASVGGDEGNAQRLHASRSTCQPTD